MADSTLWWVLAGAVIAVELLSGTFYLLMLSLGFVAAAISAHVGASPTLQWAMAALVGGGSVLVLRSYKQRTLAPLPASANHDVNLDIGETLLVQEWLPDSTGVAKYRGASWNVMLQPGASPTPGRHRIVEVQGSRLIVCKVD